jgi:UPF0042 nucleotide-binding protein
MVAFLEASGYTRAAVSIDARSGDTLSQLPQQVGDLKSRGIDVRVLFLDAKTDTLLKRFSETRRRHPLRDGSLTVAECIARERDMLANIGSLSHHVDTSDLNPNALRAWMKDVIEVDPSGLTLLFQSFGYKHGIPLDADLVFDVRCLPNPYYDPRLRALTGKDQAVIDFLAADSNANRMLADIRGFIETWLPCFIADHRSYVTVAIGCTGGEHRSVYFVESLARYFSPRQRVLVRHRELAASEQVVRPSY